MIRVPPHSTEAEVSVLGALLLDKDAVIAVAEFLEPGHFYDDRHKEIYESIVGLFEQRVPIDVLTVSEELKKRKSLKKVGGSSYLAELSNRVPTAAHVEHYGKIVKDQATKRSLMSAASKLVELSMDESLAAEELLDKAESEVFSLTQRHLSQSFTPVKAALADSFDRLDELHKQDSGLRGIPTGFEQLDSLLAGFQRSNLIILAARPGVGKTSMALNIAQNLAVVHKRPVGIFSLEMSKEELVDRLLVAQADIDAWRLKTGKLDENDFTALANAMGELAEAPMYIDDTPAQSILEMRTKARRLQVDHGIDLLIVDYLQLARSRNLENRVQEVGEISQGLKNIARELKIPVLALSQLSRAVEQRELKRPQLADLRESGCLLGETLLTLVGSGKRVPISSLVGKKNMRVSALNEQMKLVPVKISKVFSSGKKVVYRMTLKSGKVICASGNHPFLKVNGWSRLDTLQIGDRIATPRKLEISSKGKLSENKLILIGHLIGDGCYVKRQPLHYTNQEKELINIVYKAALADFEIKPRIVAQESWYHLYLSAGYRLARGRRNPIVAWLDEIGIYGQHSFEKIIPEIVFEQPVDKVALFLRHLWATDGCIHISKNKGPKVRIYYATNSFLLAEGVSNLLLRLGILSTLIKSTKKGYKDIWNVVVQGKTDQQKFLVSVGCVGKKAQIAKLATSLLDAIHANPNNDVVPKEIWEYIDKLRKTSGLSQRGFHARMGWAYSGTQRYHNDISRARLAQIIKVLSDQSLKNLSQSDIYWDEVKEIKKIGIREVYDATVPEYANFVANDIIVHNSIEQDSDVVMFLWREDEDSQDKIILNIAKHRNGPLGQIKFFFRGDRIRFFPMEEKRGKTDGAQSKS
ncbi:MAG: Replicative DNA helicase [Candidatus Woesebacteria bacterium GW2011_GWB1_38_5b]|uniref:Replicative DNA helicase n=1 Tax=Candidatus Woesebacteria bacterium GW2011_GWB1_38_5b TaxID=1618569 RepID=A0A0G0MQ98_9BACT|nr:MAG: Replicative DNA helicase [Candidatus Woesebacteria bacterium GW2011_GWB1_38_5b]